MKKIYKLLKIIIALLLIPFCISSIYTIGEVISYNNILSITYAMIVVGIFVWVLVYHFFPEPKRFYILGHELTHAIWSLSFGGKIKGISVKSTGGETLITKSNFATSLSPYFFPFYVVLIIFIFSIGNFFWNWNSYILIFYFLIGFLYASHLTYTFKILKIEQPDIIEHGYLFSTVIIFLGNMIVLLIGITLFNSNINVLRSLNLWIEHSVKIFDSLKSLFF
ncbi:MAG: hypothetical protein NTZ44_04285 [Candidatus Nomurabacteria bacterium]|nr:hypothetical protein [Candidatus Nomurabacteria bacterium]